MNAIARQVAILFVCGCSTGAPTLQAQIFSGHEATESQLTGFVASIKQLQPGRGTADDVLNAIGAPHAKSGEDGHEVWQYSFLVSPDDEAVEMSSLEQQIAQLEKDRSALRDRQFKVSAEAFRQRSDGLFAESDRIDAAIDRIEESLEPLEARRRQMSFERRMLQVDCGIAFDHSGGITDIQVGKSSAQGREIIYSRSASPEASVITENGSDPEANRPQQSQASAVPPESPSPGQIYFNTKDKAFYGWDGSTWVPLNGGGAQ
jgi:outer membrane protein assembly factor BamE (lipoprotein component of BamABCDE complex)